MDIKNAADMFEYVKRKRMKSLRHIERRIREVAGYGYSDYYFSLNEEAVQYLLGKGYNVTKIKKDNEKDNYNVYWGEGAAGIYKEKLPLCMSDAPVMPPAEKMKDRAEEMKRNYNIRRVTDKITNQSDIGETETYVEAEYMDNQMQELLRDMGYVVEPAGSSGTDYLVRWGGVTNGN